MRIVQLITQARGGPVDHAVELAIELDRLGHQSHLVGPVGAYAGGLDGTGVQFHPADMTGKTDLSGARTIARTLRQVDADVVHCQDRRAGLVGRLLALLTGTPTVYTLHGVPDSLAALVVGNSGFAPDSRRDRVANLLGERLLARTPHSHVVTPCEAVARYARDHVRIPADRVSAVHNGVGPDWLHRGRAEGVEPPGTQVVTAVWLGVMQPVKRVPELVRAVADVADLRLLLVGDGPERAAVASAVREAGVGDRVELAGFVDEPAQLLARADLFVLPSAAEACPMAVLQAMALGLPVVASRAGGIPEVVRDGIDGLLITTADDAALREALRVLTKDEELRRRLGTSAQERIRDRFTVAHSARALLAIYEGVAG